MISKHANQLASACTAVLFITLALGVITPTQAVEVGGTGVDVSITRTGDASPDLSGATIWLNGNSGAQTFTITITEPAGSDPATTSLFFGAADTGTDNPSDQFTYTNDATNQAAWTGTTEDEDMDGQVDGFIWDAPPNDATCIPIPNPCPVSDLDPEPGTFTITLTPISGIMDFAAEEFLALTTVDGTPHGDGESTFQMGYDATDPDIGPFALTGGATTASTTYTDITTLAATFSGITDATSGVASTEYSLNGADYQPATSPIDLSGAPQGASTLTLRVTDVAGNDATQDLTFDVDTVAPTVSTAVLSTDGAAAGTLAREGDVLSLSFDLDEASPVVSLLIDGVEVADEAACTGDNSNGFTCSYTVAAGLDGAATFSVDATDAAGNVATQAVGGGVTVDTTAPSIDSLALANAVYGSNGAINDDAALQATFTASDAGSGIGTTEYSLDGVTFSEATSPISLEELGDGSHTLTLRVTDAAGTATTDTLLFTIDETPPVVSATSFTSSNADVTLAREGDTLELAFTLDDGTAVSDVFIAGTSVAPTCTPTGLDYTCTYTVGASDSGAATYTIGATDAADNSATVTGGGVTVDTGLPVLESVSIASDGTVATEANDGDTITLTWTPSETLSNVAATINGEAATVSGDSASVVVDTSFAEGPVSFTIDFEDAAGNAGNQVVGTTDASAVEINFGDLVATTITSVSDTFVETGDSVTLTATTAWAEDPDGPLVDGDPYAFARVALYDASDMGTPLKTKTSSSQGVVNFQVSQASVAVTTYVARTTGYAPNEDRAVAEAGDLAGRSSEVTFTELVATGFAPVDGVASRGASVDIDLALAWAHAPTDPATGLDVGALMLTANGQSGGVDDLDLVPDTPTSGWLGGFTEYDAVNAPGVYRLNYAHGLYESLALALDAGPITDAGEGGATTTFNLPTANPTVAHWVGAYVSGLAFANVNDPLDTTGDFVNLDDPVTATATVVYTPNYDPGAADGLLAAAAQPVAAEGATVALFEDSFLDGAYAVDTNTITANTDAMATSTVTGGVATFTLAAGDFTQDTLRDGANTYGLTVFPTVVPDIDEQSIVQANAADLDAQDDLTFTALDLAYEAGSATNVDDGDLAGGVDRWWLSMDNVKGAADTDPSDADAASVDLTVTWRHDGNPVEGATVKVHDGTAFLNDGSDLTGTSAAGAVTDLTIEPDAYGLDAVVQQLEFQAVSAPEPGSLVDTITQPSDTFSQEFLWTRVGVILDHEFGFDGEVDLGMSTDLYVIPVYYHDEHSDGSAYYFDADYTFSEAVPDLIVDEAYAGLLDDTVVAGTGFTTMAQQSVVPTQGLSIPFTVLGGCTNAADATACAASASIPEAGYHTYQASLSTSPHGLAVDSADIDVLYTAVVLDAGTDRLTAPVGTGLDLTAQAYYAHTRDVDGTALGDLPYTNGVLVDVTVDGAAEATDVSLDAAGALATTVAARNTAGHFDVRVVAKSLADDGSDQPLTLAYDSASMERVWLSSAIGLASDSTTPRTDHTDRNLQVRGRDVDVFFDVTYTDGVSTVEVDDVNEGFGFTATDTNPDVRFTRSLSTTADTAAATVAVLGPDAQSFAAAYDATCDGTVDSGCWKATLTGFDVVAADQSFDLSATVPLTQVAPATPDLATALSAGIDDAFEVDFTAVELALVKDGAPYQGDLDEFWYNLGTDAAFQVAATWAHDGAPALDAVVQVEDPAVAGSLLAGATVTDADDDGTYDVTVPSPGASERRTYSLAAASVPSTAGEADLEDGTPFTVDVDSLTAALAQPDVVHTRALFDWIDTVDGIFVNKGQEAAFGFTSTWEHDGAFVDVDHVWSMDLGAGETEQVIAVPAGTAFSDFALARSQSGAVTLAPTLAEVDDVIDAPRGIHAEAYAPGDDTAEVTWTAIKMDLDDTLDDTPHVIGDAVPVAAKASLEHDVTDTPLASVGIKLLGTSQTTVVDGFASGVPGYSVNLLVLSPSTITVFGEGIQYDPGMVYGGGLITASIDDSATLTFE